MRLLLLYSLIIGVVGAQQQCPDWHIGPTTTDPKVVTDPVVNDAVCASVPENGNQLSPAGLAGVGNLSVDVKAMLGSNVSSKCDVTKTGITETAAQQALDATSPNCSSQWISVTWCRTSSSAPLSQMTAARMATIRGSGPVQLHKDVPSMSFGVVGMITNGLPSLDSKWYFQYAGVTDVIGGGQIRSPIEDVLVTVVQSGRVAVQVREYGTNGQSRSMSPYSPPLDDVKVEITPAQNLAILRYRNHDWKPNNEYHEAFITETDDPDVKIVRQNGSNGAFWTDLMRKCGPGVPCR